MSCIEVSKHENWHLGVKLDLLTRVRDMKKNTVSHKSTFKWIKIKQIARFFNRLNSNSESKKEF